MKKNLKFHPPGNEAVHLALTNGHTALVEVGGTLLDGRFHRVAISQGCFPEGLSREHHASLAVESRPQLIKKGLRDLMASDDEDAFLSNGRPSKVKLDQILGFVTERSEMELAWEQLQAELESGEEEEGERTEDDDDRTIVTNIGDDSGDGDNSGDAEGAGASESEAAKTPPAKPKAKPARKKPAAKPKAKKA